MVRDLVVDYVYELITSDQIVKYDRELRDLAAQIPWNAADTSNHGVGAKPDCTRWLSLVRERG